MATLRETFKDIADAIREKGVSGTFKPIEMASKIGEIQTGEDYGYLTFTATTSSGATLNLMSYDIEQHKLLKSTDGVNWTKWDNPSTNGITIGYGESVYIKADEDALQRTSSGGYSYNNFKTTGGVECSGDIRSLTRGIQPGDYSYWTASLFYDCTSLTKAPELPSTNMSDYCYYYMLSKCSLVTAPNLPATTLADYCYVGMFRNCSSLTQAPELPATTLTNSCYSYMFDGCSSLKRIKMNASSGNWGGFMFNGCTSLELIDMTGSTGVPQLSDVNNFKNTNSTYKIVVPDSLYDKWIAATNWSSASVKPHIMKQSDWNSTHPDDILP